MWDIETVNAWLSANWGWLLELGVTGGGIAGIFLWFKTALYPAFRTQIMKYIAMLLTQMLGFETEEAERIVQTSPVVARVMGGVDQSFAKLDAMAQEATAEHLEFIETTLVNYAFKLKSGVLTNDEYVLLRGLFDRMLTRWREKLPLEVVDQLNKLVA